MTVVLGSEAFLTLCYQSLLRVVSIVAQLEPLLNSASRRRILFVALLLVSQLILAMSSGWCHSPSIDEVGHLAAGLSHWEIGRFDLYAVNPPLIRLVAAIPLLCVNKSVDWSSYSQIVAHRAEFPVGRQFIKVNGERSMWLFFLARAILILIVSAGTFLMCWRWSTALADQHFAVAVVVVLCLSPSFLTNVSMVTPDAGSAAALMGAVLSLRHYLFTRSNTASVICGVAVSVAMLTKFTCLAFLFVIP